LFLLCSFIFPFTGSAAQAVPASASFKCTTISSIGLFYAEQTQSVKILGSCFGTHPAYNGDSNIFKISVYPPSNSPFADSKRGNIKFQRQ
jgi:hypothetical protein